MGYKSGDRVKFVLPGQFHGQMERMQGIIISQRKDGRYYVKDDYGNKHMVNAWYMRPE